MQALRYRRRAQTRGRSHPASGNPAPCSQGPFSLVTFLLARQEKVTCCRATPGQKSFRKWESSENLQRCTLTPALSLSGRGSNAPHPQPLSPQSGARGDKRASRIPRPHRPPQGRKAAPMGEHGVEIFRHGLADHAVQAGELKPVESFEIGHGVSGVVFPQPPEPV